MGISRNLRIRPSCLYPVRCLMMPKLAPMGRQVVGGRAAELQCHQASDWPVTAAVSAPQCSRNGRAKGGDQHEKSGDLVHDCKGVVGANGVEKRRRRCPGGALGPQKGGCWTLEAVGGRRITDVEDPPSSAREENRPASRSTHKPAARSPTSACKASPKSPVEIPLRYSHGISSSIALVFRR